MSCLFIADLHLQHTEPVRIKLAKRLFRTLALDYDKLFILGDFVEYWLGDDSRDTGLEDTFLALKELADSGTAVYLMHGNRDFLFSTAFSDKYSIILIRDEEFVLHDEGESILLMHGDTLCTDDQPYQHLRTMIRNEQWQKQFLALSIEERMKAANELRQASKEETRDKSKEIMDVNINTIISCLRRNKLYSIIHGHTHRPATHNFELDNTVAKRTVLGDWQTDGACIASLKHARLELFKWPGC